MPEAENGERPEGDYLHAALEGEQAEAAHVVEERVAGDGLDEPEPENVSVRLEEPEALVVRDDVVFVAAEA